MSELEPGVSYGFPLWPELKADVEHQWVLEAVNAYPRWRLQGAESVEGAVESWWKAPETLTLRLAVRFKGAISRAITAVIFRKAWERESPDRFRHELNRWLDTCPFIPEYVGVDGAVEQKMFQIEGP